MDSAEKWETVGAQYTRRKQNNNEIICVGHHYAQVNTNSEIKTLVLLCL